MNAGRRNRPTFSQSDIQRLLACLGEARKLTIYYGIAHGLRSPEREAAEGAQLAIDGLAKAITGNAEYFWTRLHSTGNGGSG